MLLEYKKHKATLYYCPKTKSYYGELCVTDSIIAFQVTQRHAAEQVMRAVVDQYLQQADDF